MSALPADDDYSNRIGTRSEVSAKPEQSPQRSTSLRERLTWLRWLAVIPIAIAVIFLFFGVIWTELPQILVGLGLLAVGAGIWILFARDD